MVTRYFTVDELEEMDAPDSLMDKEYVESGRWSERWTGVLEADGKFYRLEYELPSTEMQEGLETWERYETPEGVPGVEVELTTVITEMWMPVE